MKREREKTEKERKKAFNVWTDVTPAWDDHTHTRMLPLGCSRLTDSNLPGLKSTGFHRVYGQPAKLGSTLCADYNVCHVTLDFGTGEKGV